MAVVSKEIADKELEKWLFELEISVSEDDASEKGSLKTISEAIQKGNLILNEDFSFTHVLKEPIGKDVKGEDRIIIKELKYKSRLKTGEIQNAVSGTKAQDVDGRFIGFISALTAQPKEIIRNMDSRDYKIGMSIAVFFM